MPRVAEAIQKQERVLKSRMKNDTAVVLILRDIGIVKTKVGEICAV
jgi:hypothetical protein